MYTPDSERYKKMEYNKCGESGLFLPKLSLGLWQNFGKNADYDTMKDIILTAFDNGVTYFDLANNYGPDPGQAEINFGKIFAENLKPHRDEIIIATKAGYDMWEGPYGVGGSRKYLTASLNQSLKRMGIDYVDIFYHHTMTPETPLRETAICLADIVRQGKALYTGLSNYNGKKMHRMHHRCDDYDAMFVVNQNRYNILDRDIESNGLKEQSESKKKGLVAFSPLAQGRLTDKYKNGIPKDSRLCSRDDEYKKRIGLDNAQIEKIGRLCDLAEQRGEPLSQMAIKWLWQNGVTSVLIGARTKEQLLENLGALSGAVLSDNELAEIERIIR